jgi:hypothetical protein
MNEWVEKISPDIHNFLKEQGKIITEDIKRLLENHGVNKANDSKDNTNELIATTVLNSYQSSTWSSDLSTLLNDLLVNIYVDGVDNAASQISGSFVRDPKFHEYAQAYAEERTAELVGTGKNPKYSLEQSTRDMLRSDLTEMMDEGMTPAEIANALEENYAFSESRSLMIARTETGFAYNRGGLKMYDESGVKLVYVTDGDYDEDCRAANGQVWTTEYASINALQHPNCVRTFAPCLEPGVLPDEY